LETPITGGNVSFYNQTLGKAIYPTPVIGILGIIEDSANTLKIGFRNAGDILVLLDGSPSTTVANAAQEFSSSEYSKRTGGIVAGEPPAVDLAGEKRLIQTMIALAEKRAVHSAHDISDGGLAVTLAESCFVHNLGAQVTLSGNETAEYAAFGERGARVVV